MKQRWLTALLLMAAIALSGCRFAAVESGETLVIAPAVTEAAQ